MVEFLQYMLLMFGTSQFYKKHALFKAETFIIS